MLQMFAAIRERCALILQEALLQKRRDRRARPFSLSNTPNGEAVDGGAARKTPHQCQMISFNSGDHEARGKKRLPRNEKRG